MQTNIPGFYPLNVKKLVRETAQAVTVYFEVPDALQTEFTYLSGQYLTLLLSINGEEVRRAYSLCTSPNIDTDMGVTIKEVEGGKMSTYMNQTLKEGDTVMVMPPNGKFVRVPEPDKANTYVLFGGGSGITPLMSITQTVLNNEPQSKIYLVYANRNPESVIFKTRLEEMEKENKDRFKIIYSYDKAPMMWFGLKGFLTEKIVGDVVKLKIGGNYASALYYICGPSPMMDAVKNGLKRTGIPDANVFTEYFTASTNKETNTASAEDSSSVFSGNASVHVKLYGKESDINVATSQTILDAANAAGLQPPYSCTVGVCTTCRAKVLSGKVEMLEREGLSDAEIEEGYVLTCQSLPRSASISIVFE
jgi:ring-1,2-phenylacetyl-CoA epoxidase subunit PaaE